LPKPIDGAFRLMLLCQIERDGENEDHKDDGSAGSIAEEDGENRSDGKNGDERLGDTTPNALTKAGSMPTGQDVAPQHGEAALCFRLVKTLCPRR